MVNPENNLTLIVKEYVFKTILLMLQIVSIVIFCLIFEILELYLEILENQIENILFPDEIQQITKNLTETIDYNYTEITNESQKLILESLITLSFLISLWGPLNFITLLQSITKNNQTKQQNNNIKNVRLYFLFFIYFPILILIIEEYNNNFLENIFFILTENANTINVNGQISFSIKKLLEKSLEYIVFLQLLFIFSFYKNKEIKKKILVLITSTCIFIVIESITNILTNTEISINFWIFYLVYVIYVILQNKYSIMVKNIILRKEGFEPSIVKHK